MDQYRHFVLLLLLHQFSWQNSFLFMVLVFYHMYGEEMFLLDEPDPPIRYSLIHRLKGQAEFLRNLLESSDVICVNMLRMDRRCFSRLCALLKTRGRLKASKYLSVREQVAIFLNILAHHTKIRVISFHYNRSYDTISKYFKNVLRAVMLVHRYMLVYPESVDESCEDTSWKFFQGCLGALDGTYIQMQVPAIDKPRYRSRKCDIATNVLAVCDRYERFVYVLSGWEGSAADGRVLKDAILRENGLKIPSGNYYLCDGGYTNGEGSLTPYRGVRYHLREWEAGNRNPQNYQEYFNMKHAKARNVIERVFGQLKGRWAILRSNSFYPVETQNMIIMACTYLHNFIKMNMDYDPVLNDEEYITQLELIIAASLVDQGDYIEVVEPSLAWSAFREDIAQEMWQSR